MNDFLLEMLECPACHRELSWNIAARRGQRLETAEAVCRACGATYPVREGIGLFLTPDLPHEDLWEQADSNLIVYLREHPDVERLLLGTPLEELNPADQFFRAMALEERGDYAEAQAAADLAGAALYTREYRACWDSQQEFVTAQLSAAPEPVVDLASGRGYLVEVLARRLKRPVVATDFSPRVLRRNRRWLEFLGLYDSVSLVAFDARRTPFKDGAVAALTTNLGLPNIRQPSGLLSELRRIVSGSFLAISHFYPEEDPANAVALQQHGLSDLLYRQPTLEHFHAAGWQVEAANVCRGRALPTPTGTLLQAGIDSLPVAETTLEWCTLVAQ